MTSLVSIGHPIKVSALERTQDFILERIAVISRSMPYGRKDYDLPRGNAFEGMVVELLASLGVQCGRYYQEFPVGAGHLIRANQVDLWVKGGTTGKIYQLETKTRRVPGYSSIFSYSDIAIGGCRTWDEKNAAIASKKGRKPILATIIVCENKGYVKVAGCLPEEQLEWKRGSIGYEVSYLAKQKNFIDITVFAEYLKTL